MALCAVFLHRWSDLTKYKLLIIQTARQLPGLAWLEYDLAFQRDAAASGLNDWSKMNLDLYNFHLRPPAPSPLQLLPSALPGPSQSLTRSRDSGVRLPFCHSWNEGQCQCPFGRCQFRHKCSNCEGEHSKVDCPFPSSIDLLSHSPSAGGEGLGTDWPQASSDAFVHSVNNLVALPSRQHDLPYVPQSVCSVPVPVISGVPVYTFSPLSP